MPQVGVYTGIDADADIAAHAAIAAAHHAKTTKASEITSEAFDDDRIPAGIARDAEVIEAVGEHAAIAAAHHAKTPAPTKEFFVPVTYAKEMAFLDNFPVGKINALDDDAYMAFYVPADFTSITEAVVSRRSDATATHRLNYYSSYGDIGGAGDHTEALLDQDTAETDLYFYEQDISGILSFLAPGDWVGIKVLGDSINTPDDDILGIRFKYS